jgi:hypothetical protein
MKAGPKQCSPSTSKHHVKINTHDHCSCPLTVTTVLIGPSCTPERVVSNSRLALLPLKLPLLLVSSTSFVTSNWRCAQISNGCSRTKCSPDAIGSPTVADRDLTPDLPPSPSRSPRRNRDRWIDALCNRPVAEWEYLFWLRALYEDAWRNELQLNSRRKRVHVCGIFATITAVAASRTYQSIHFIP